MFTQDFPHAICQVLAMPLAKPGMLQVDIMSSVFTLVAVGVEVIAIDHLMNSCHVRLLIITGGTLEVILTMEVKPEEFNFEGNLHND